MYLKDAVMIENIKKNTFLSAEVSLRMRKVFKRFLGHVLWHELYILECFCFFCMGYGTFPESMRSFCSESTYRNSTTYHFFKLCSLVRESQDHTVIVTGAATALKYYINKLYQIYTAIFSSLSILLTQSKWVIPTILFYSVQKVDCNKSSWHNVLRLCSQYKRQIFLMTLCHYLHVIMFDV